MIIQGSPSYCFWIPSTLLNIRLVIVFFDMFVFISHCTTFFEIDQVWEVIDLNVRSNILDMYTFMPSLFSLLLLSFMSIRCLQDSAPGFVADKTVQCWKSFLPDTLTSVLGLKDSHAQSSRAMPLQVLLHPIDIHIYIYIHTYSLKLPRRGVIFETRFNEARCYFLNHM